MGLPSDSNRISSQSVVTRFWHFAQRKQSTCQSCVLREVKKKETIRQSQYNSPFQHYSRKVYHTCISRVFVDELLASSTDGFGKVFIQCLWKFVCHIWAGCQALTYDAILITSRTAWLSAKSMWAIHCIISSIEIWWKLTCQGWPIHWSIVEILQVTRQRQMTWQSRYSLTLMLLTLPLVAVRSAPDGIGAIENRKD